MCPTNQAPHPKHLKLADPPAKNLPKTKRASPQTGLLPKQVLFLGSTLFSLYWGLRSKHAHASTLKRAVLLKPKITTPKQVYYQSLCANPKHAKNCPRGMSLSKFLFRSCNVSIFSCKPKGPTMDPLSNASPILSSKPSTRSKAKTDDPFHSLRCCFFKWGGRNGFFRERGLGEMSPQCFRE